MRISSRISFLLFATLLISIPAFAQPARIAYIDADKLLKLMPQATDAKARMDQLSQAWTKEAEDMQAEIDRKQADFDRRKLIMTDAERSATALDIANLKKRHDDYLQQKFGPNGGELFQQEAQIMGPAYDKLTQAIKEVAEEGSYDYVIDRSSKDVILLYTNSKFDITLPVARKLGIESSILSAPLVPALNKSGTLPNNQAPREPNNGMQPNATFPQVPTAGSTPQQPTQPGFNSGGYNPNQIPPPAGKPNEPTH